MLKSINISLSTYCGANCIFCPKAMKKKNMTFELAKKIIDEISSDEFKKQHQITNIEVGENGDSFLNKELIKILRYIKLKLPHVKVEIFTNFQNFAKDKAQIILSEKLIDRFNCNIDASSERNYFVTKGLHLQTIKKNIIDFLEARETLRNEFPLTIYVLTLNTYINVVHHYLGSWPVNLKDYNLIRIKDDFQIIKEQWENILDPKKDTIIKVTNPFLWAERERVNGQKLDYKKYVCPNLQRIKHEAFIAPDGTWYACCYDSNTELALGNVEKDKIGTIYSSPSRKNFIEKLEKREFDKLGGPCRTVNCCQNIYYDVSSINNVIKSILCIKFHYLYIILKKLKSKIIPKIKK